jgi:hypothetical protein
MAIVVIAPPLQIVWVLGVTEADGEAFTVTAVVALKAQPLVLVTLIV